MEVTFNDGAASFTPHRETQESSTFQVDPHPASVNSGVLTQGRTASGSPVSGSGLTRESIVNVGGSETSVKAAIAVGLVQANGDGSFSVVSPAARAQAQLQHQQQSETQERIDAAPEVETVAAEVEGTITTFATNVSPSTVMGAVLDFSNGVDVRDSHISAAASEMGVEPSQVRAMVEQVRGAFETQARAVVDGMGVPSDDVFAWAYQHKPELMQQAIRQQATQRSTKGYQQVAQTYLENLDTINPAALLNAELGNGLKVKKANNGRIVIQTPDRGDIEYRAAVRSGLIKIGRAGGKR
jgi:hypothetical protein